MNDSLICPPKLKTGDTVALLACSGPVDQGQGRETSRIKSAADALAWLGLNVHIMPSCYAVNGYLAGADSLRADDLMQAFSDPGIKGIFPIRGGYGAQRLLHLLDYDMIHKNPKIFAGYSDTTALHTVLNKMCGFVTYHAPMAGTELWRTDIDPFTIDSFVHHLFENPSNLLKTAT